MSLAFLKGRSILWDYEGDDVLLIKDNYNMRVTSMDTFKHLFIVVGDRRAALKEDCIYYTIFDPLKPLCEYPYWYIQAYNNGFIFEDVAEYKISDSIEITEGDLSFIIYSDKADLILRPGDIVMRNYKDEVMGIDSQSFFNMYEKAEERLINEF